MAITSLEKGWIEVNDTICDFLGYTRDELMSKTWAELTHPEDIDIDVSLFNEVLEGKREGYKLDKRFLCKNGDVIYSELSVNCLRDEEGKVKYFLALINDITERKQAGYELRIAKKKAEDSDRLKTEFLNNMSHEIRTPMNGIIGFSELLDDPGISEERRSTYVQMIQNSSQKLLQIIDDILEISTLETKKIQLNKSGFNLNDLLFEVYSIFELQAKNRNIQIYLKKALRDHESEVYTDKQKLYTIIHNLLTNALKFTSEGFVEMGYTVEGKDIRFYVKDTGIGISENAKNIIFERFSQEEKEVSRKVGGLGLGLSISRENAQLLGGDVSFESQKGEGATFYVDLPEHLVNEVVKQAGASNLKSEAEAEKICTILIAEDEEMNYLYLEAILGRTDLFSCRLIHARNGEEAVAYCKNGSDIDLVLMDIKMPVMNGYEATERIKELYPNLPVIAQTAYSTYSDQEKAKEAGCNDFLSKPIRKDDLYSLIEKYVCTKLDNE